MQSLLPLSPIRLERLELPPNDPQMTERAFTHRWARQ
jgi:hypothetical protein